MATREVAKQEAAVSVCWAVSIDGKPLGAFISCEGLGLEVVLEQREEGGNNGFVWQIPTRVKYTNIKLSRAVCPDTAKVIDWIIAMNTDLKPRNATIKAMTAELKVVAEWSLQGVIPVRWTGPSLNADGPKVATETIEIAHHGFGPSENPQAAPCASCR